MDSQSTTAATSHDGLVKLSVAAAKTGLHADTIRRLLQQGLVPALKTTNSRGGHWLLRLSDLYAYFQRNGSPA